MAEINIKLKGLSEIKQELRALQFDLANATDPQQMAELSQRAGELRDNLVRANEQVAIFAAGSPFEQSSNALGIMGSQIRALDFEGAAESAKLFAQAAKGINGQVIATQLKGLGSTVTTLGSTFAKLGVTILANPIFLIAAAIAGIVAIIGVLMNKLGFLQPILDAVGAVFEAMKWAIDKAVESIKAFLDWLGLTNFAAEDFASKQQDAMQKVIDKSKELEVSIGERYDHEIRMAKIAGKDTTKAEIDKQKAIIKTAEVRLKAIDSIIEQNKISKKLTDEEIDKLKELRKETEKTLKTSNNEIQAINAQADADRKRDREKEIADNKAAYQKMLADRKKYEQDRLNAIRQIRDLELDLMQEGIQKDLALNQEKYARLIADTLKNENLNAQEKEALTNLLRQQEFERTKEIELTYSQQLADALKEADAARKLEADEKALEEAELKKATADALIAERVAQYNAELDAERFLQDQKIAIANQTSGLLMALAGKNQAIANVALGIEKAAAIADIVISTQREIAGYAANPTWSLLPDGGAAIKASAIAAAKIRAGISIATIAATTLAKFKNGGGGGATGGGGSTGGAAGGSVQAAQPSVNLFGNSSSLNNLNAPTQNEGSQEITVKAVVSETEVTGTQNKIKKLTESAAL